jgi:hypothetical protein
MKLVNLIPLREIDFKNQDHMMHIKQKLQQFTHQKDSK